MFQSRYEHLVQISVISLIVDCGANIRFASRWYAQAFPKACIVAIEPDADSYALVELNTDQFGEQITTVQGTSQPFMKAISQLLS